LLYLFLFVILFPKKYTYKKEKKRKALGFDFIGSRIIYLGILNKIYICPIIYSCYYLFEVYRTPIVIFPLYYKNNILLFCVWPKRTVSPQKNVHTVVLQHSTQLFENLIRAKVYLSDLTYTIRNNLSYIFFNTVILNHFCGFRFEQPSRSYLLYMLISWFLWFKIKKKVCMQTRFILDTDVIRAIWYQ